MLDRIETLEAGKGIAISIRAPLLPDGQDIFLSGTHREEGPMHTLTAPLVKHARSLLWPRYLGVRGRNHSYAKRFSCPVSILLKHPKEHDIIPCTRRRCAMCTALHEPLRVSTGPLSPHQNVSLVSLCFACRLFLAEGWLQLR